MLLELKTKLQKCARFPRRRQTEIQENKQTNKVMSRAEAPSDGTLGPHGGRQANTIFQKCTTESFLMNLSVHSISWGHFLVTPCLWLPLYATVDKRGHKGPGPHGVLSCKLQPYTYSARLTPCEKAGRPSQRCSHRSLNREDYAGHPRCLALILELPTSLPHAPWIWKRVPGSVTSGNTMSHSSNFQ